MHNNLIGHITKYSNNKHCKLSTVVANPFPSIVTRTIDKLLFYFAFYDFILLLSMINLYKIRK